MLTEPDPPISVNGPAILCSDKANQCESDHIGTHISCAMDLTTIKQATETVEMTPDKVEQQRGTRDEGRGTRGEGRGARDKHRALRLDDGADSCPLVSTVVLCCDKQCNRRHGPGSRAISRGPLRRCFGSLPCKRDESLQPQHQARNESTL